MAAEPFRFVHAANLRLDEPLVGLDAGDAESRRLAEDATLIAWNNVVEACVSHNAEFLLLTGCLGTNPPTLRAWRALADGCAALAEYGVPVLLHVSTDVRPAGGWSGLDAMDNFILVAGGTTPVVREGRVVASIASLGVPAEGVGEAPESDLSSAYDVFRVGLLSGSADGHQDASDTEGMAADPAPVAVLARCAARDGMHYLALAGGSAAVSHTVEQVLLHHPGSTQGLGADETGPMGCSLIEVNGQRAASVRPVATAPVRWEQLRVGVEPGLTREQLVERMQRALFDLNPQPCERLWRIAWHLIGTGDLFDTLRAAPSREALASDVDSAPSTSVRRRHDITVRRRSAAPDDPVVKDYLAQLDVLGGDGVTAVAHDLAQWVQSARQPHTRLAAGASVYAVTETARRLGLEWLQPDDGRES
jgi:hypothetical protein